MRPILSLAFNLVRITVWVMLGSTIFVIEYLWFRDDERVELSLTSPFGLLMLVPALAFLAQMEIFDLLESLGIERAYTSIWLCVHKLASWARYHFPGLVTLRMLKALKSLQTAIPMAMFLFAVMPFVLPSTLAVQYLGPWILRYWWHPLFTNYIPAFYLFLNRCHYRALNPNLSTVRLLHLLPGRQSDPIRCRLIEADVHIAEFEAVSYTWGGHLVLRRQIFVNDKSFWVTQNILLALRALRQSDAPRVLWIDQMCINQQDIREKTDQVTHKMHLVYRNAKRVIVWLGASTPDVDWAFEKAKLCPPNGYAKVQTHTDLDFEEPSRSAEQHRYIDAWTGVLDRKWFRRIWIVQEVALARHLVVVCGANELDWEVLKRTVLELKQVHRASISNYPDKLFNFLGHLDGGATKPSLLDLAIRFRSSEATYPEDKLIGLLALAEDGQQYPDIHYRYRPVLVFANFTAAYIQRTQSLAILALAGDMRVPFLETSPCSWAANWETGGSMRKILWGIDTRSSIISRVGKYCASGDRPALCRREPGNSTDTRARGIFLHGWYVDTVKAISVVASSFEVSDALPVWKEFAQHHTAHRMDLDLVFENLILAEMYNSKEVVPWSQWYVTKYKRGDSSSSDDSQRVNQASEILESLCDDRRMFVTVEGKLGVGPSFTKPGDHVCVFEGGAVPFLVRYGGNFWQTVSGGRLLTTKFDYKLPYHLVGQAVVSGMMYASDRDIEDQIRRGVIERREILLR